MNQVIRILVVLMCVMTLPIPSSMAGKLQDFQSDGCSLFPDKSRIQETDWCDCCFQHDIAYWQGGTRQQRLVADKALKACILTKTDKEELAELMYTGVRFGGSPYFYNWYRWGYGWSYERKYQPLTERERKRVNRKLHQYFKNHTGGPCD